LSTENRHLRDVRVDKGEGGKKKEEEEGKEGKEAPQGPQRDLLRNLRFWKHIHHLWGAASPVE